MKTTSGKSLNSKSMSAARWVMLFEVLVGGLVGMLTGAAIGLPFFYGVGAVFGALAGLAIGIIAALWRGIMRDILLYGSESPHVTRF